MIQVTRKDSKESLENLLRRFNRKVQQAGTLAVVKQNQYFEKPISKRERRERAFHAVHDAHELEARRRPRPCRLLLAATATGKERAQNPRGRGAQAL